MSDNPELILQKIHDGLDQSTKALEEGGNIDMVSLDKQVRQFCDLIPNLPAQQAKECTKQLADLIERLNQVVNKMMSRREEIEDHVMQINQRGKAQKAYSQATTNTFSEA